MRRDRPGLYRAAGLAAGEVVRGLKVDPELGRRAQRLREAPRRIGGHATASSDDLVDPLQRHPEMPGEVDLGDLEGLQEILEEDRPRMGWNAPFGKHASYEW